MWVIYKLWEWRWRSFAQLFSCCCLPSTKLSFSRCLWTCRTTCRAWCNGVCNIVWVHNPPTWCCSFDADELSAQTLEVCSSPWQQVLNLLMLLKSVWDNRCIDIYNSAAVEGRDFWGRASTARLCAWYLDDELMILPEVGESSSSQLMPMTEALISLLLLIILRRLLMNQHIPP